jgi:gamma-glutamyltranspeptidase/glutathione hydrolase
VKDDRNLHGPGSIAVPGVVAGMEEAHRRHARMPWRELLAPSITFAGEGLLVDWWTTLMIASCAADLRRYPASAAAYLVDGLPPNAQWGIKTSVRLPQDRLKATLSHLATEGPRDFYQGDIARSIASDVQAGGGALSVADLAAFRAHGRDPLAIPYRGGKVLATPELTCGPTLAHTLRLLQQKLQPGRGGPDAAAYSEYALALQSAYRERLSDMGDADGRRALGAEHLAPSCTTHFSVVDREGNMAAVTQTLLSTFGSKFVTPQSGVTMNNGIMWFDPTPGGPNSLAPGKRCLTNYTPVLAEAADGRRLAHPAGGDADAVLRDGLRHGPGGCDPYPAHRCQRRRDRDRRCPPAGAGAGKPAGALRLRGSADTDRSDEIRLPERGAARWRDQQRRHRNRPAMGRRGRGRIDDFECPRLKPWRGVKRTSRVHGAS